MLINPNIAPYQSDTLLIFTNHEYPLQISFVCKLHFVQIPNVQIANVQIVFCEKLFYIQTSNFPFRQLAFVQISLCVKDNPFYMFTAHQTTADLSKANILQML